MKKIKWLDIFTIVLVSLALGSCVPQVNTFMQVALINAPEESKVEGLSAELERSLKRNLAPGEVGFVPASRIRYQERARDIRGSRAMSQGAIVARVFGAEYSALVSAPVYDRSAFTFRTFNARKRSVTTRVQLEVILVDAASAEPTATYLSKLYVSTRLESTEGELPDKEDDPDLEKLIERAFGDITRPLATDLAALAGYAKANEAVPVQGQGE